MKNLLGGKGANLEEMSLIGLPVPPGFTITTEVCTVYHQQGRAETMEMIREEVLEGIKHVESIMGTSFGDQNHPCLLSVRSGARVSMPGMMDTVLNIGLNDRAVVGLARQTGKERFAWDSYRRFIQMYGDVVMNVKTYVEGDEDPFEMAIEKIKNNHGIVNDQDLTVENLVELVADYKELIQKYTGKAFPEDPHEQLWNSIMAVFESWFTDRAIVYRKLNDIPVDWGTAVNVQAMVYGNMGKRSASGVAFTRDAASGENKFNGEYLIDAQGEDVVAGIRTPQHITREASVQWAKFADISEEERLNNYPSLEEYMPEAYEKLVSYEHTLEDHFQDMQDLEFTIQEDKLWILQTRNGKRTGAAMVKIAMDMMKEGRIDRNTALLRVTPSKLNELLHPVFDFKALKKAKVIAKGLPASPGAATGQIIFFSDDAETWQEKGLKTILIRTETSADDLKGMAIADGILTARGGQTSHAAVVARGMGKCCITGAGSIKVNYKERSILVDGRKYYEGDWLSINGTTGEVYEGKIETQEPKLSGDFEELMLLSDEVAKMTVRTNADTPETSSIARKFGAKGIGLCRTEHMFFEDDRIKTMREMIMASDEKGRKLALRKLLPMQKSDFIGIFEAMEGLPVTIRLLDPPLHEFIPLEKENQAALAKEMGVELEDIRRKVEELSELNPMLGHRGCRLGNTYPEISEMQTRAIIEAALELKKKGVETHPEIMIPLTGTVNELRFQEHIIQNEIDRVLEEWDETLDYKVGTMIEVPRAALVADHLAKYAEFFSFGTNDLTQMTYGYSRDDAGKFLPIYLEKGILTENPFQVMDQEGVGQLVKMAVEKGRASRPDIKLGICGEHGGEPKSVEFCHKLGLDYVSCSPFRIPIARLAAAQAAIR